ncbi:MAG TPA: response regulator transcription factor [Baekduia sp.]|uniref:response regulator transcription factor n=1 Tax=Baekduia sp. TaxID=2600305 RepID=UPI002D786E91|nr:response regulator transcription factor [Baekduia sp.]HET6507471.1 response regulator transcription factor [Baekduia sp.]
MDARILLVEDDRDLRTTMAAALAADGHAVDEAPDGTDALGRLAEREYDVVLLDVGLGAPPDGVEVCRRLRGADTDVYIMMLTARDAEADVVLALEAGADDYVTKPVGIAELRSRARAALRRVRRAPDGVAGASGGAARDGVLRHDSLVLDPAARTARVGDEPLHLTPSELAVLEALMTAGGAVLSRPQLVLAIYGDDAFRDPRAVDFHVHHLRDKLAAAGGRAEWVVTVRAAGYRLDR